MLKANDIIEIYNALLGRNPENKKIIDSYLHNHKNISGVIKQVQSSVEYKNKFLKRSIPKSVLVYIHIPKTAGTFLRTAWLKKNVSNYFWSDENKKYPLVKDLEESYIVASSFEMLGGHLPLSTFLKFPTLQPRIFLNVLREPIARIISFYNHIKNNDPSHPLHKEVNSHTLYELLMKEGAFYKMILNEQVRYLVSQDVTNFKESDLLIIGRQDKLNDFIETVNNIAGLEYNPDILDGIKSNSGAENYEKDIASQKDFTKALEVLKEITKAEKKLFNELIGVKVMSKSQYVDFIERFSS
ncbi:sulfotransferase family 2 domain-containing protein [Pseudoalteromonas atlantica]|uniref:sulfotransferase family 2 domain-containing protein n=1 Tax=Pseudoalteromonas atlantica TaxID=288 RepID=UPI003A96FDDC